MDATRVVALMLAIILAATLLFFSPEIARSVRAPSLKPTTFEENPEFLWANRWLDLLIQAFILFAAVAAISVQLGRDVVSRGAGGG